MTVFIFLILGLLLAFSFALVVLVLIAFFLSLAGLCVLSLWGASNLFVDPAPTRSRLTSALIVTVLFVAAALAPMLFSANIDPQSQNMLRSYKWMYGLFYFVMTLMADAYLEPSIDFLNQATRSFRAFWQRKSEVYFAAACNLTCIMLLSDLTSLTLLGVSLAMAGTFVSSVGKAFREISQ